MTNATRLETLIEQAAAHGQEALNCRDYARDAATGAPGPISARFSEEEWRKLGALHADVAAALLAIHGLRDPKRRNGGEASL